MDPLSITVGVVSLMASLTTLSVRIAEFSLDLRESPSEIRELGEEINDLQLILKKIEDARSRGTLAGNLTTDLGMVLKRLDTTVIETELLLKKCMAMKIRAAYWAITGKKQCLQLARRLDSYKSTLGLALTLSDV